jgi:hypothetical protein
MVPVPTNRNINSPTQPGMLIHPLATTAFPPALRSALSVCAQPMALLSTVMGRNATAMLLGLGAMMRNWVQIKTHMFLLSQ